MVETEAWIENLKATLRKIITSEKDRVASMVNESTKTREVK